MINCNKNNVLTGQTSFAKGVTYTFYTVMSNFTKKIKKPSIISWTVSPFLIAILKLPHFQLFRTFIWIRNYNKSTDGYFAENEWVYMVSPVLSYKEEGGTSTKWALFGRIQMTVFHKKGGNALRFKGKIIKKLNL